MLKPGIIVALNGPNLVPRPEETDQLSSDTRGRVELAVETAANRETSLMATVGRAAVVMADYASQYAESRGITLPEIVIEDQSYETISNALYTKLNILEPRQLNNVRVVTADYHAPRAKIAWERVLGTNYNLSFDVTNPDYTTLQALVLGLKEKSFGAIDKNLIFSSFGRNNLRPDQDTELEMRLRNRHPRSPDSFWSRLGVKALADRVS